jgi:leucyl aminopeptidase
MFDRPLDCLADPGLPSRPFHGVRPGTLAAALDGLPPATAAYVRDTGFTAEPGGICLLPGTEGVAAALLGLGEADDPFPYGALAEALPPGTAWRPGEDTDVAGAALGFCLGAYRFSACRSEAPSRSPLLALDTRPAGAVAEALSAARATWLVRDLVNMPANFLGPEELAEAALRLAAAVGASAEVIEGPQLEADYPAIAAVGRGSARPPRVVHLRWHGVPDGAEAPRIAVCGKGVCFDTGGYDLKPAGAMLNMKKDMGGAAHALGLARMIADAALPVRLDISLGCVENSISGTAMRPRDVLRTRKGLTVEVGNTDAEGRLVLADLLAAAAERQPDLLIDFATLTGAARAALGPDLPALFSNDADLARIIEHEGESRHDPVWQLPLWRGYNSWLASETADLNNISSKPHAGAIIAALFLQRFVVPAPRWAHLDIYSYNDIARPGRPEGADAQTLRAMFGAISRFDHHPPPTHAGS